jgi:hypothetical protein
MAVAATAAAVAVAAAGAVAIEGAARIMPPMEKIKTHLLARVCWLAFGAVMAAIRVVDGIKTGSTGMTVTGIGWLLLGVLWFLSPLIIGKKKGDMAQQQRQAALGSDSLRNKLLFTAGGCVIVGMVLRYGFGN